MDKEIKSPTSQQSSSPVVAPGVPQQKISKPLIIFASIGATLVMCALVALSVLLDHESEPSSTTTVTAVAEPDMMATLLVVAIVLAFLLLPGVIVALIVLPKLLKNRKK